ncbi:MAG: phosphate ABC transporter permease subunit PstC [bacterium]|nr:phosphate ABC transporter permease subunit PstC [bacterium]
MEQVVNSSSERKSLIKKQSGEQAIKKRVRPVDGIITISLFIMGFFSIFTTIAIVVILGGQTLLFFDSRAYIVAKLPVVDDALSQAINLDDTEAMSAFADAVLAEPIDSNQTEFLIAFDDERTPFQQSQFIQMGTGELREVMRVVDRGRRTIKVERGLDNTSPLAYSSGTLIFSMSEQQVTLTQELPSVQSIEEITWEQVNVPYIQIGDEFEFREQTVRVTDFNSTNAVIQCVIPVSQSFNRGDLPRRLAQALSEGETFDYNNLLWRVESVTSNEVTASCVPDSTSQVAWSILPVTMVKVSDSIEYQDLDWRIASFTNQIVRIERCAPNQFSEIPLLPTFGRAFKENDIVEIGVEIMRVDSVAEDAIVVERCLQDTNGYAHVQSDGSYPAISVADEVEFGEFLTATEWVPQNGAYGILPLVTATVLITFVALIVAVPLGLGAAIYLSEYAPLKVRNTLKPILEILAGVPTVVFGFFAVSFVSPMLQGIFGNVVQGQNILTAGIVVGILIVPMISSLSEEAFRAVPRALREASYGLGATKLETTVRVIFPAAISGVLASIILAASRAVGETMVVALAAGSVPKFTFNVFEGAEAMTGYIVRISGGDLSYNTIDYNSIFVVGATLFLMTLLLNIGSSIVANRLREVY